MSDLPPLYFQIPFEDYQKAIEARFAAEDEDEDGRLTEIQFEMLVINCTISLIKNSKNLTPERMDRVISHVQSATEKYWGKVKKDDKTAMNFFFLQVALRCDLNSSANKICQVETDPHE